MATVGAVGVVVAFLVMGSAATGARDDELERALEECNASIEMQERGGIPEPSLLAAAYRSRGKIHGSLLDYARARDDLAWACELFATLPRPAAPGEMAGCHEDLASLERGFGDLAAARKDYEEAIRIREEAPEDALLAKTLHASGLVLEELGDLGAARTQLERAIEIQKKVHADDLDMATYLVGLALSKSRNHEVGAEALARRALVIRQSKLGPAAPETIDALEAVADIEARDGSSREARVLLERVVWYRQVTRQPEPFPSRSMRRLARLDVAEGRLGEARDLQEAAVRSLATQLGAWAPEVASARVELAKTLFSMNQVRQAFRTAREAEIAEREHKRLVARSLPEDAVLRYDSAHGGALDVLLAIAARRGPGGGELRRAAWDELVRSRALARDERALRERAPRPVPTGAWEDLASARNHLARLLVRDLSPADATRYKRALANARHREAALSRALSRSATSFSRTRLLFQVGVDELRHLEHVHGGLAAEDLFERRVRSDRPLVLRIL